MRMSAKSLFCVAFISVATAFSFEAGAQTKGPDGTSATKPVSSGTTELTKNQFAAGTKKDPKDKDATELTLNLGMIHNGGNARLFAVTMGGAFKFRRGDDQLKVQAAANYGQSAKGNEHWQTTVENVQGVTRYDRFFGDFTVFLAAQARRDRFQGLDLRLQLDPGVSYYLVNQAEEVLWGELGYDMRFDTRRDDALAQLDASGAPVVGANGQPVLLDKTTVVHSARLFLGYERKLGDSVKFTAGLEYLQSLPETEFFRINGDMSLSAKVSKRLAVALTWLERYENTPLPGKRSLDTTMSASLVYTLF